LLFLLDELLYLLAKKRTPAKHRPSQFTPNYVELPGLSDQDLDQLEMEGIICTKPDEDQQSGIF